MSLPASTMISFSFASLQPLLAGTSSRLTADNMDKMVGLHYMVSLLP